MKANQKIIPAYDKDYYLGLAYRYDSPTWSLYYFRRFLDAAPKVSPWRKRAGEHAQSLTKSLKSKIPFVVRGLATVDRTKVSKHLLSKYGLLSSCLDTHPAMVLQVQIGLFPSGPRRFAQGQNMGVNVRLSSRPAPETSHVEAAIACVEENAFKLRFDPPKGSPGTSATVEFLVVSSP
jgi:hypothetical protein